MKLLRLFLCLLVIPCIAHAQQVSAAHLEVELVAELASVRAGEGFTAALRLLPKDGWHVYWQNPGDSGLPPKIAWKSTRGVQLGELEWPFPERVSFGPLVNYGYKKETFLLMQAKAAKNLMPGDSLEFSAHVEWVVCLQECIPGESDLELSIPVVGDREGAFSKWSAGIQEAKKRIPVSVEWLKLSARLEGEKILLNLAAQSQKLPPSPWMFFPLEKRLIENAAQQIFNLQDDGMQIVLSKARVKQIPSDLYGILVAEQGWPATDGAQAVELRVPIEGISSSQNEEENDSPGSIEPFSWLVLAFAFFGGLVLNLMPCVFPVLSLKVLNLVEQAKERSGSAKWEGFLFGFGVVCGFWILALLLLILRASGSQTVWGFQLQYPAFVVAMCFLFLALALNLFGAFEIGTAVQSYTARLSLQMRMTGSFVNGLLATALATPCTAPFMGAAVAVALTQNNLLALLIFTCLGLGMALPFVLLSCFPLLHHILPRPGAWMVIFKRLMGVPLLATVFWLAWVFQKQAGTEALENLSLGLLFFGLVLYLLGRFERPERAIGFRLAVRLFLLVSAVAAVSWSMPKTLAPPQESDAYLDSYGLYWEKFTAQRLEQYLSEGRPVLLDFTAAWCITCQLNKSLIFGSSEVRKRLQETDLVLLRADWTNRDAEIAGKIEEYGRSGVPLDVLYSRDKKKKPFIFPALLSPGYFLAVLEKELPAEK